VTTNFSQKEVTAGVDKYVQLIGAQLPRGGHLALLEKGSGTVECHTPDGEHRTGQIFVTVNYFVRSIDPAKHSNLADRLRDIWTGLGYHLIDDLHYQDQDRTVRVATPGDDYHLTIYTYGDNRTDPLAVVESPCAWPDVSPSASTSHSGG
jgi:hypothetical protein